MVAPRRWTTSPSESQAEVLRLAQYFFNISIANKIQLDLA